MTDVLQCIKDEMREEIMNMDDGGGEEGRNDGGEQRES